MKKKALIVGATGLIGRHLLSLLFSDERYEQITVFGRRSVDIEHSTLIQHIVDFDCTKAWRKLITGNDLFSCLGTTIKAAGNRNAQYKVDYTYQYEVAQAAADNGVATYTLVSTYGADPGSKMFFPRIKGELDRDVKRLPFTTIRILKLSVLIGERYVTRPGESLAVVLGKLLTSWIRPLRKYRPIPAAVVAQAMITAANDTTAPAIREYEFEEIFELAHSNAT